MTEAQLELLRDKFVLWDRASREGAMDLRDYNRRARDALGALLSERDDLISRACVLNTAVDAMWNDHDRVLSGRLREYHLASITKAQTELAKVIR